MAALAAGAKEDAGLAVAAYGAYLVMARHHRPGWLVVLGGLAWSCAASWYLAMQGRADHFSSFYAALLSGHHELFAGFEYLAGYPLAPFAILARSGRPETLLWVLASLAFLPPLTRACWPLLALVLVELLANRPVVHELIWEYVLLFLGQGLLAAMDGLAWDRPQAHLRRRALAVSMATTAAMAIILARGPHRPRS